MKRLIFWLSIISVSFLVVYLTLLIHGLTPRAVCAIATKVAVIVVGVAALATAVKITTVPVKIIAIVAVAAATAMAAAVNFTSCYVIVALSAAILAAILLVSRELTLKYHMVLLSFLMAQTVVFIGSRQIFSILMR